jgi:hypothetical protein
MKKIIISVSKLSLAFIITMIVIEIFFRLSEVFLPSIVYDDPKLGILRTPNSRILSLNEGFGMGYVNEYGYLGPGYPKEKDDNTLRIALIGASMVQGLELFDRRHFRKLLEDKLSEITRKKVEVLNFGRGGIDLRGIYTTYKYLAAEFNPDINIIFTGLAAYIGKDDKLGPEYTLKNDSLIIDYSFADSSEFKKRMKFKFLRFTSVGNLLKRGYEFYTLGSPAKFILGSLYQDPSLDPANVLHVDLNAKDEFYEINKAILEDLGETNRNNGTLNIIVMTDVYPTYCDGIIHNAGLPMLNLGEELAKRMQSGESVDYWKATNLTGHWNHHGHEVVAEFLFDSLKNIKF